MPDEPNTEPETPASAKDPFVYPTIGTEKVMEKGIETIGQTGDHDPTRG